MTPLLAALSTVAAFGAASLFQRGGSGVSATGPLPDLLRGAGAVARGLGVVSGLVLLASLLPDATTSSGSAVAVATALAIGWSARDLLPDLVGWLVVLGQGRIRRGVGVAVGDRTGTVAWVGPLSTMLVGRRGERVAVPNRSFVGQATVVSLRHDAAVDLHVPLPGVRPAEARRVLREAVFLSPWIAPDPRLEIGVDPSRPDTWRVRVTVLESRFVDGFFGSFSERVHEVLDAGSTQTPPAE
jgi:small-conductance mechanosensitive channel